MAEASFVVLAVSPQSVSFLHCDSLVAAVDNGIQAEVESSDCIQDTPHHIEHGVLCR